MTCKRERERCCIEGQGIGSLGKGSGFKVGLGLRDLPPKNVVETRKLEREYPHAHKLKYKES